MVPFWRPFTFPNPSSDSPQGPTRRSLFFLYPSIFNRPAINPRTAKIVLRSPCPPFSHRKVFEHVEPSFTPRCHLRRSPFLFGWSCPFFGHFSSLCGEPFRRNKRAGRAAFSAFQNFDPLRLRVSPDFGYAPAAEGSSTFHPFAPRSSS